MDSQRPSTRPANTDRSEVLQGVLEIVAEQMGMDPMKISPRDALQEDLGCDSLDIVEITMEIEDHFDISVPDEVSNDMKTIGDVTNGVLQLLGQE